MIRVENLTKVFRTKEVETTALNEVSLEIKKGEFVSIMGPSGCGKSTLLNLLGMLDKPESGSYTFQETEISSMNEKERAGIRKKNIGFIFQNFNLIDELTVFENIELPMVYNNISSSERKKRVNEIAERIGISHRMKHYPQQLSGGQQQRVAVARALVNKPSIILADEPTGNLDSSHGNEVMELLCELNEEGTTIVNVTHSAHDASYSSRIINLLDGQIVSERRQESGTLNKTTSL
ncbi:ATP-binding cassette domain-containing protein [Leptobacterium flavescens]|uniref:ATP-binding cassette domain-containing protein n=1 Tax=Leptobacterium flavescens TaxID=472055 RepID=A0A6P0UM99_9FLAO|nr:ABC transporter ATP-binding protein [Leptobacterium flavescens]NER14354.1 ATP-binding cassette domain-containing protein [Leptobacterium flavescens]